MMLIESNIDRQIQMHVPVAVPLRRQVDSVCLRKKTNEHPLKTYQAHSDYAMNRDKIPLFVGDGF
jgi:hypothetical protein